MRQRRPNLLRQGALLASALALVTLTIRFRGSPEAPPDPAKLHELFDRIDRMALVFAYEDPVGPRASAKGAVVSSYFIDRFEVTNREFHEFVTATDYRPKPGEALLSHWSSDDVLGELSDHPVVFVSARDADAYAKWMGKELPSLDEWHHAAGTDPRGSSDASIYYTNCLDVGLGGTTRVGTFERGRTRKFARVAPPVYDLVGNVWEWTSTHPFLEASAFATEGAHRDEVSSGVQVELRCVQGGSFNTSAVRGLDGALEAPNSRSADLGFRCVRRDARSDILEIVEAAAVASASDREGAYRELERFGLPLRRLLHRIRFDEATVGRLGPTLGDADFLVPLDRGRMLLFDEQGTIRLYDVEEGTLLATAIGYGEFLYADAVDVDGDGVREVYFATRSEGGLTGVVTEGSDRLPHLFDAHDGSSVAWSPFPPALLRRTFGSPEPSVEAWQRGAWERAFLGFGERLVGLVPRLNQRLYRMEVGEDGFKIAWEKELPISDKLLFDLERHEILVPGFRWFWPVGGERSFQVITKFELIRASDGVGLADGCAPGGVRFAVPFGPPSARRWLLRTNTDDLLEVARRGNGFEFVPSSLAVGAEIFAGAAGPNPGEMVVYGVYPEVESKTRDVELYRVGADGTVLRRRRFEGDALLDPLRVDRDLGLMLRIGEGRVICLDADLQTRWSRNDLIGLNLERQWPRLVRFRRQERAMVSLTALTGFSIADARTSVVSDTFDGEDSTILSATPVPSRSDSEADLLVVSFRDRPLYVLRAAETPRDHHLKRLLDRLDSDRGSW